MIKNGDSRQLRGVWPIVALIIGALIPGSACEEPCSKRDFVSSIGHFDSKEEGLRASIPKLSAEISRCPQTELFRIMWRGPGDYGKGGPERHSLLYQRTQKRIGYEDDFLSGISSESYYADASDISAVAEKHGTLTDFTLYDRRPR